MTNPHQTLGGMGPTAARTDRSATTTDQQGRGHYNVAVGVGGGQREGKSGPILVVAGVGMHARSSMVNRRVWGVRVWGVRRSAWCGVAVKFGASKRDQGASDQRDYASDLVICTLA